MAKIDWVVLTICLKFLGLLNWTLFVDKGTKDIEFWVAVQITYQYQQMRDWAVWLSYVLKVLSSEMDLAEIRLIR